LNLLRLASLSAFCCVAACCDVRSRRIPNPVNLLGLTGGVALSSSLGGFKGLADSGLGAALGLAILLAPFLLGMVGGGDVKFMAAAGSIAGWQALCLGFLAGATIGGVVAALKIIASKRSLGELEQEIVMLHAAAWGSPAAKGTRGGKGSESTLPYAVPLSLGLIAAGCLRAFS